MLSPLKGPAGGSGRQHFRWTTTVGTGEHGSGCEECWVDVETGQPGVGDYTDRDSNNSNYNHGTDINVEHRHAAMHAPSFDIQKDQVVPETMINVGAAGNKVYF